MIKWMFGLAAALLMFVLSGCEAASQLQVKHFCGHWIVGIPRLAFVPLDNSGAFGLDGEGLPPELLEYVNTQPGHIDPDISPDTIEVVYLEFLGTVKPSAYPFDRLKRTIHVKRVLKWGPARPDVFRSRRLPGSIKAALNKSAR